MIKTAGKFIWRIAKCIIGAAVVCFAGYYASMGLNWLTGVIMKYLAEAAIYRKGNWVAIIVVIIALTIGGLAFELLANGFKNWGSSRAAKKAQRRNLDYEE